MSTFTPDAIEQRILSVLQKNGRLSNGQLAEKVGLSESACLPRGPLLEQSGNINRYVMLIDQAAGKPGTVFVRVTLEGQQQEKLQRFEEEVGKVTDVMECYLMSGDTDYLLRIIMRDNEDYLRTHKPSDASARRAARSILLCAENRRQKNRTLPGLRQPGRPR